MVHDTLERLREHVDPRWSRTKVERELDALEARIAARTRRLYWASGLTVATATLVLVMSNRGAAPQEAIATLPRVEPAPALVPQGPEAQGEPVEPALARAEPQEAFETLDAGMAGADEPRGERQGRRTRRHRAKRVQETQARLVVAGQAWQALAREGRYHEAYLALSRDGLDRQHSAVDELLLAGDAARLSGHAREAVPYYRDALARAGNGPRAHLSAFTLGRTLLHDLHDGRGAAQAFARAYAAAPRGQLAEEALAGEADGWTRAGDRERARAAAQRYLVAFPHGRRVKDMERVAKAP